MKVEYTMQHQQIDGRLRFAASFTEGEPTRFDSPVSDETMIKECKSYEKTWPRRKVKMTRSDGRVIYDSTSNVKNEGLAAPERKLMKNNETQVGQTVPLDSLVRKKSEICRECGCVLEGEFDRRTGQWRANYNPKCGCASAHTELMKKLGLPNVKHDLPEKAGGNYGN